MRLSQEKARENSLKRWGLLEDRFPWKEIEKENHEGTTLKDICKKYKMSRATLNKARERGLIKCVVKRKHSEEVKKKMSEKRKKWLKENPDKHPWKRKDRFKSEPCENVKRFLKEHDIQFIEEFSPEVDGRHFSIDIAIPDKMIALEVNGNQHYERDGRLKPYYKEREELLEQAGWNVYQIHYSACFSLDKWGDFLNKIKNSDVKVEFDYFNYVPQKKSPPAPSKRKSQRKFTWPSKEELEKLVWEMPIIKIGKKFNVSDNAINRLCKKYNIAKPPVGYWAKINAGWSKEEALSTELHPQNNHSI